MKTISVINVGSENSGVGTIVDAVVEQSDAKAVIASCSPARTSFVYRGGISHQFCQFGSATLIPDVKTFLEPTSVINPLIMMHEAESLANKGVKDAFQRTFISSHCRICTPHHTHYSRLMQPISGRRDYTGAGIAFTECIYAKDLIIGGKYLRDKIASLKSNFAEQFSRDSQGKENQINYSLLDELMMDETPLLEHYEKFRAQAKILAYDEMRDFAEGEPVRVVQGLDWSASDEVIGVTRTFGVTRGEENKDLAFLMSDDDNCRLEMANRWLGKPVARVLDLDEVQRNSAGIDRLAVTHCDKLKGCSTWKLIMNEVEKEIPVTKVIETIEEFVGVPVVIESSGKLSSVKVLKQK
jgi:adenylosuccinate synthase